jgi:glycosyltransferase involved in cell wall biosynthesis
MTPLISAVMPTYNKGPWIHDAIDSVLRQTCTDWELVVVDDGSTDDTARVLCGYRDSRIKVQTLTTNVGRAQARNIAIRAARGRYIAICDSDDVSAPRRFEYHAHFLNTHPEVGVVSAYIRQLSPKARHFMRFPTDHVAIERRFAKGKMGAAHGASMIRMECFTALGLYCEDLNVGEDFELFRRFVRHYRFQTLPEELLQYRSDFGALSLRVWAENMRAHRYAVYRSECDGQVAPVLTFREFSQQWRTRLGVYTMDMLRFAHFNLRARVFSGHVLR